MIYEYKCLICKNVFTVSLREPPRISPVCTNCGNNKTQRTFDVPGVIFKGSGFYRTDNLKGKHDK